MNKRSKIKKLQSMLNAVSNRETKEWFEKYLKHSIQYRGVKTPEIAGLIKMWRDKEKIGELEVSQQLSLAIDLIRQSFAEDKFAGIIYLQKYLLKKVEFEILAENIEDLFKEKCFFEWSTTDWLNVRVLSPLIDFYGDVAIRRFSRWVDSENLWQKRASIVSLRAIVDKPEFYSRLKEVIKKLVSSEERFIQTGIGWVISDLSKCAPKEAEKIVEAYFSKLSVEVIRRHTKYLPKHRIYIARKSEKK